MKIQVDDIEVNKNASKLSLFKRKLKAIYQLLFAKQFVVIHRKNDQVLLYYQGFSLKDTASVLNEFGEDLKTMSDNDEFLRTINLN